VLQQLKISINAKFQSIKSNRESNFTAASTRAGGVEIFYLFSFVMSTLLPSPDASTEPAIAHNTTQHLNDLAQLFRKKVKERRGVEEEGKRKSQKQANNHFMTDRTTKKCSPKEFVRVKRMPEGLK
jgi:hypothetical protein